MRGEPFMARLMRVQASLPNQELEMFSTIKYRGHVEAAWSSLFTLSQKEPLHR